jgi:hypothetical protein
MVLNRQTMLNRTSIVTKAATQTKVQLLQSVIKPYQLHKAMNLPQLSSVNFPVRNRMCGNPSPTSASHSSVLKHRKSDLLKTEKVIY